MQSLKQLYRCKLCASDGEIGHVKDFYFDDKTWAIRYLVADTGSWLPGRKVLLSPHSFGRLNQADNLLPVNLTRAQIENSPSIDVHKPVSRLYEEEYYRYYGWPSYWQGDGLWGLSNFPILKEPAKLRPIESTNLKGSGHIGTAGSLRSTQAVNGYLLQASDGRVGHVCDYLMDSKNWAIGQLVIKTGHRLSGKEVLIPTKVVERINYEESTVFVNLTNEAVRGSPEHKLALAGAVA